MMSKQEALTILRLIDNAFTMNFTKEAVETWIDIISEKGDYEPTLNKTKYYIANNSYRPKIADIIAYKPKYFNNSKIPEEETKEYRLKHDENFGKEIAQARERWKKLKEELGIEAD
ncbi:hypothetical protein DOS79_09575 [Staphylococcus felis]|uniref:Replicative helicase inhibitor G39P N-terminal domain-containing protein n=1 Tax=Staphylococcus felis TaxID=46127 RepID=A0AAX1RTS0_9STAP|nr:hypothetical protein [Staphylococcus felis]REH76187.1 hypothetical protein DOS59_08785 [Staphylococcus felis]REH83867.1 hypothetical protein DOS56_05265 [Staphylococcus felis]REH85299.1 hypothetical protein DOS63_05505 [Staphylococcus felis]REH99007.1 hypothetical protein DOS64_10040 [Staphylococcus felis]REI15547.1 hypothetical protein DOS75_09475 [Staphylococcus felis]